MLYRWLSNIEFLHPYYFVLLALIPLMLYWQLTVAGKQRTGMVSSRVIKVSKNWKYYLWYIPFAARMLALLCIIIALARPQSFNSEQFQSGEGIDIILCMDVSGSMNADDFNPSRLEAAKQVAANFVNQRTTDRIGLVKFSREGFSLVPLTTDHQILVSQIYAIDKGVLEDGTAIGDGLGVSIDRLREASSNSKVIILLTDGDDHGGLIDPGTAVEMAKSYGIKIYTIGVGTAEKYVNLPTYDQQGNVQQNRQKLPFNEELLKRIAKETGGLYFHASDNNSLSAIYDEINLLEKSPYNVISFVRKKELFFPWAIAAIIFLLIDLGLRYTVLRKLP